MAAKKKQPNKPVPKPSAPATIGKGIPAASLAQPGLWERTGLWSAVLFALAVLLYANTFSHDFAQDDAIVITDNMFTTQGVKGWPGLFQYDTFYGFFKVEGKAKLVAGGRYRPLTPAMFALEYQLFGGKPGIMHFFNALWYGLTALLLYKVLLLLFKLRTHWDTGLTTAWAHALPLGVALLFAVHPIHTEAVANIKGRDEIITFLGSLGALWWVLKAREQRGQWLWPALAGACFLLGLLAKENAITFLGIVPLALYFFTQDSIGQIAKSMLPLVIAAGLFLGVRGSILGWDLGEPSQELMNNPFLKLQGNDWVPFSADEKLATITYTLGQYAKLLVIPHPLTHDYYPRQVDIMHWGQPSVLLSLLLYVALLVWAVLGLRQKRLDSFGIWFYLMSLSIVSNIVFPVGTNMSERFVFIPSAGLLLALLVWLSKTRNTRVYYGVVGAVTLVFAVLTMIRNPVWKDNFTLFSSDIATSPNSAKLRNAMAGELCTQWVALPENLRDGKISMIQEAAGHVEEALRIHPTYKQAWLIKGNIYNYLRQYDTSIAAYQTALQYYPDYMEAQNNLNMTYRDAGRFYGEQQGDLAKALQYLEMAYQGNPSDYETTRLLGVANGMAGNAQRAIELFMKNTQLQPNSAYAWHDLYTAYGHAGQQEQAAQALQRALSIDPDIERKLREKNPK